MVAVPPLDLDDDTEFKKFCEEQGEDYQKLHEEAGKHFTASKRTPYTKPLTKKQRQIMAEEDVGAFDLKKIEAQTRAYCKEKGIDYDQLVENASKNPIFQSDTLPKPRKFTKAELDAMLAEDDEIFGDSIGG